MCKNKSIIIFCDINKKVGIGHYSRSITLKRLIEKNFLNTKVLIILITATRKRFSGNYKKVSPKNLNSKISKCIHNRRPSHVFFNLSPEFERNNFKSFVKIFLNKNIKLIAIDNLFSYKKFLYHIWVPNVYLDLKYKKDKKFSFGWNKLLINENKKKKIYTDRSILILTGGTDKYQISKKLPIILEKNLQAGTIIKWVIGPFAQKPKIKNSKLKWIFYRNQTNLSKIYSKSGLAFVQFGVSFFEVVQYGIPCAVYSPKFKENFKLQKEIKKKFFLDSDLTSLVKNLRSKLTNIRKERFLAKKLSKLVDLKKRDSFIKKLI
tara:strand:- start:10 stop:969 length:960 start_codon:yes stop_codon:yes gene_type:complete